MAEGIEEAESNNSGGETIVMLGAVMPCEMTSSSMGGIKRELETVAATATSPTTTPIIQQQPINLKSEDFDREHGSPSNSPARPLSRNSNNNYGLFGNQIMSGGGSGGGGDRNVEQQAKNAAAAAAQAQLQLHNYTSGTMQGMLNLQKLQNLASMQQHTTMPSLQNLQDLTGLASSSGPSLNSPLNLSVGGGLPTCPSGSNNLGSNQMPQLILASGQLMQGIQGAQLLIPTSQGITTQTILTIPFSQQITSNEHLVQSLANLNGNTNLGKMSSQQNHMHPSQGTLGSSGLLSPHLLSNSVQQLLTAIQPQIFSQQTNQPQQQHHSSNQQQSTISSQQSSPAINNSRVQTPKASPIRSSSSTHERHHPYDKLMITPTTTISQSQQSQQTSSYTHSSNGHSQQMSTSPQLLGNRVHSPTSLALNNINRLAATNGEITITKAHGPSPSLGSSSSSSSHAGGSQHVPRIKLSPSSMRLSPTGSDDGSGVDLLDDSPDEPTINQTNCNVVDGIDLDEIKEFAKAFKLRRLSLGLTQTQVGQALSVTEGPAYSQSAICSALAAQMYAAQLSSQQQAMFEKLDITPKSAQKIKPVLERWMKEAEESHWHRYKSGQNHLTDFIGVEPSKKRKRRTSFTPQALELLNAHFERNTHPSGTEITGLAHQLGYEREVIRIWFCNKRQALKNTDMK